MAEQGVMDWVSVSITEALFFFLQSTGHKCAFVCHSHVREMRFKLVGDSREIGIDRFWVDVCTLESEVQGEGLFGGFNVDTVQPAEGKVRIECRKITIVCSAIDRHAQIDGELSIETLHCPGSANGLPGHFRNANHFLTAPSITRGVLKRLTQMPGTSRRVSMLLK